MSGMARWLRASDAWFRAVVRLYPRAFRTALGASLREAYRDRTREAYRRRGAAGVVVVWLAALFESARGGAAERLARAGGLLRPGAGWSRDAALVVRRLRRSPVYAGATVGTLAVGLGAFAVVYSAAENVLLEPLPYERPDDLYFVWRNYTWLDFTRGWLGGPDVAALATAGGPIEDAAGLRVERLTLSGDGGDAPEEVRVMTATDNLFDVLGAGPLLGRGFAPGESGVDRAPVVVLGHDLWRRRYGADRGILGREVRLDGEPFTVIGVTGPEFRFARHSSLGPPVHADVYTTFDYALAEQEPGAGSFAGLVRARPGTTPEALGAAVAAVGRALDERHFRSLGLELFSVRLREDLVASVRPALVVLGLCGAFLVLVLTANLATLMLGRAAQREREFAVSRALGADRVAVARAAILEGGLLGLAGGIAAAAVAVWGTATLVELVPEDLPRRASIAVDGSVVGVVLAVAVALGLAAGAFPGVWAARTRLSAVLREAGVRGDGGGRGRARRGMVVVQVALSLMLLTAGGLLVRSFESLLRANPGFDASGVLTFRVPLPGDRYTDAEGVNAFHQRLEAALAGIPGVVAVGATSTLPLSANASQTTVAFPGAPGNTGDAEQDAPLIDYYRVRPGFRDALRLRLVEGESFGRRGAVEERTAVIGERLAQRFFPSGGAVGATMHFRGDSLRVIGVVRQARLYDVHADGREQVFIRLADYPVSSAYFLLRTTRRPLDLVPEVRALLARLDPAVALSEVRTMDDVVGESLAQQRLSTVLIGGFAVGALLLAAMGLYGVVSNTVARRRHELGVRLALGADPGNVVRLVLGDGVRLVALGIALGLPGIYLVGRVVRGVVVGVSPFDATTIAGVALVLGTVALLACYLPARHVTSIDPVRALRSD